MVVALLMIAEEVALVGRENDADDVTGKGKWPLSLPRFSPNKASREEGPESFPCSRRLTSRWNEETS